jgi:hypothetical protein
LGEAFRTPKEKLTQLLTRVSPPPYTSIHLAIGYADSGLDRSIPLFDRWRLVSTAVRLATLDREFSDTEAREQLGKVGLCRDLEKISGRDVCGNDNDELADGLIELVQQVNDGRIPVTEELIETLSQTVIVLMARLMDQHVKILEKQLEQMRRIEVG